MNVKRCDNPACTNGPAGTRAVSENANPAGWTRLTAETLDDRTIMGDFDTMKCAADVLLAGSELSIAVGPVKI